MLVGKENECEECHPVKKSRFFFFDEMDDIIKGVLKLKKIKLNWFEQIKNMLEKKSQS